MWKNKRTPKQRLKIYEIALEDWSTKHSYNDMVNNYTLRGFCMYFSKKYYPVYFYTEDFNKFLPELANKKEKILINEDFHFNQLGKDKVGRQKRIKAIKEAIKEVKLLIK